ncbi:peptidoglycan-binding domain-containing protein [Leucobacter denitrificans]|uniref:Peptidoglycan-binding protein n=1 Tax=Leucobacter denitrificans TaxID=683042 RepID=A0A7G9S2R9_9MICO|nr:hypothetical protein [Leucobacter denitrificans]QNN62144.1 hypothetical protein H9L06_07535 [Leucobacter denitrificans]
MKVNIVKASLALFCVGIPLVLGGAAGYLVFADDLPEAIGTSAQEKVAPVTYREFTDTHNVEVDLVQDKSTNLRSSGGGRVTAVNCKPGQTWENGKSYIEIDGEPIVNLATSAPLWRDISMGDFGKDVEELQAQLAKIGYNSEGNGVLGPYASASVVELRRANGSLTEPTNVVEMQNFLWVPSDSLEVSNCNIEVGQMLAPDQTVASVQGAIREVSVKSLPDFNQEVGMELVVDDIAIPLEADGSVADQSSFQKLVKTPSYIQSLASSTAQGETPNEIPTGKLTLKGAIRLSEPIRVAVIPPAALFGENGANACVLLNEKSFEVSILGSELGQTFVVGRDGDLPELVNLNPKESRCP